MANYTITLDFEGDLIDATFGEDQDWLPLEIDVYFEYDWRHEEVISATFVINESVYDMPEDWHQALIDRALDIEMDKKADCENF